MINSQHYESQRKNPRFVCNNEGFYFFNKKWESCHIFDLNLEGIGLNLQDYNIDNRSVLQIKISSKKEEKILDGEVVYCKNNRAGAVFKNLKPDDLMFLKNVINNYSRRFEI